MGGFLLESRDKCTLLFRKWTDGEMNGKGKKAGFTKFFLCDRRGYGGAREPVQKGRGHYLPIISALKL